MPRYFFHVHHDGIERDRDGTELTDKHAAWEQATRTAGEIIKHIDGGLRPGHDWRMEVTDEFARQHPLGIARQGAEKIAKPSRATFAFPRRGLHTVEPSTARAFYL